MCLVAKPIVDGLENDLQGRARVMRLNVLNSVGMNAARRFGVRAVPTFVVFDGQGKVIEVQIGMPNRAKITSAVTALAH
jgi:thioredoxin-like negative regulator of GroEL